MQELSKVGCEDLRRYGKDFGGEGGGHLSLYTLDRNIEMFIQTSFIVLFFNFAYFHNNLFIWP